MSENTSASGGYLRPITPAPAEDAALDDILQAACKGITGIDGALVRPRWQAEPPNLPPQDTDWAAIGVTKKPFDTYVAEIQDGPEGGDGETILIRHESMEALVSFYGPNCQANASVFRDGLFIAQNREQLQAAGIELVEVGDLTRVPELIKNLWFDRCDVPFEVRRAVTRTYAVLNLLSAEGVVTSGALTSPFEA